MTVNKRIRSINGGRARIWWLHHGREAVRALQLITVIALFLFASTMDYRDQLEQANQAREVAARRLNQERISHGLPRTTFVIEAATPDDARKRIAEIAGDLDTWRYNNPPMKGSGK